MKKLQKGAQLKITVATHVEVEDIILVKERDLLTCNR